MCDLGIFLARGKDMRGERERERVLDQIWWTCKKARMDTRGLNVSVSQSGIGC